MKKKIIIFCTAIFAFSLMAFGFMNWSPSATDQKCSSEDTQVAMVENDLVITEKKKDAIDIQMSIDTRFLATITKEDLHQAKSVLDIVPKESDWPSRSIKKVRISTYPNNDEQHEYGDHVVLNQEQTQLLQATDYSENIRILASTRENNSKMNSPDDYNLNYMLTIIPEKEASYNGELDELIAYMKENCNEEIAQVEQKKLQAGFVTFLVMANGTISNVELDNSSGYPDLDDKMIELIKDTPETWNPAENSEGEKVEQMLVLFFGAMGC